MLADLVMLGGELPYATIVAIAALCVAAPGHQTPH
jgi:hypothetical protein